MANWLQRRFRGGSFIALCLVWITYAAGAHAALTCAITVPSANVTITAGGSVNYTGTVSGGKSQYTFKWTFAGGTPASSTTRTSSTSNSVNGVTYGAAGTYTTTLAITDSTKPTAQSCSSTRTITVQAGGGDTTKPVVNSISAAPAGPTYTTAQTVTINATATDNVGVSKVEFYDGATLKGTDTTAPYSVTWAITSIDNGTHNWTAKAYDAAGNVGTSTTLALTVNIAALPNVSINSTSQNCGGAGEPACSNSPVTQQPAPGTAGSGNATYRVLAVNDLGMHCGDLDTRISSILPPFNVVRAVVINQPRTGTTNPILNPAGVTVWYSPASNPNDPALSVAPTRVPANGGVFKTNFWAVGKNAYDPFYPGITTGLNPFATPYNLTLPADQGLPMPEVERFYLGDGVLTFNQQPMPGMGAPYQAIPFITQFAIQTTTQPFFTNFAFGYPATVKWHTAEGLPITVYDDFGRENPYPLMRIQARDAAGTVLATTDTVVPVSGEANCQACHADRSDGGNGQATTAITGFPTPRVSIDDPKWGSVPPGVSVEWASDKNILKLHDIKNPTAPQLITNTTEDFPTPGTTPFKPVVCQTCHYTPALDLAQLGPLDGATGTLGNGRQQGNNQTMSRVMHNHHGQMTSLFPAMPAPIQDANGNITNQTQRVAVLDQTCYMCHPGPRTKCLRGAMATRGILCQDCHGNMTDVGNDFSKNKPGGAFILAPDFYTNAQTPRVPWANEPTCGSCHTGDAVSSLANSGGTITSVRDNGGNTDGLRLLQAFRTTDVLKKPIIPTNKRFAEVSVSAADNPAAVGNPKLYRVSVSRHGAANGGGADVFCEACHGATHSEWPNANPNANDNVTSKQLQGHVGVISECSVCHGNALDTVPTLDGPHGLHPIGANSPFANSNVHKQTFTGGNYSDAEYRAKCMACHGGTSRATSFGTVLSRAQAARTLKGTAVAAGKPIGCTVCHRN